MSQEQDKVCKTCGEHFTAYEEVPGGQPQVNCPKCASFGKRRRAGLVRSRQCLQQYLAVEIITDLPIWKTVETHTSTAFKIDLKGSKGGASWNGRIVIWARGFTTPPQKGDVVNVRVMMSEIQPKTDFLNRRLDQLTGSITKQAWELARSRSFEGCDMDALVTEAKKEVRERFRKELLVIESHRYVVLEPCPAQEPSGLNLAFAQAYSKTTLKGLGRQFKAELITDHVVGVLGEASGQCRSGRFGTTYVLAVVSKDHPLIRKFSEDGHTETTYLPESQTEFDQLWPAERTEEATAL